MGFGLSKWDQTVDVVVVGSGIGGLSAAIAAHDRGAKVLVLEKAPKFGGVSAYSGGEVFVPANHLQAADGVEDSLERGQRYLAFLAGGYADAALQRALLETGPLAARYYQERAGVKWKIVKDFPDYHYPRAPGTVARGRYLETELFDGATLGDLQRLTYLSPHMPNGITHDELFAWGGFVNVLQWDFSTMARRFKRDMRGFGPGMMAYFVKAAILDRGIPAMLEAPARALVVENGAVVGVRAERGGKEILVRAKRGVVLAAGGYDWNPEMARCFELLPEWQSMVQPSVEGDAMTMGTEIGGAIAAVPAFNLGLFFGYRMPGEEHDQKPLWRGSWEGGFPHAIWVNRAGARFADESFYRDYLPKTRAWDGVKQEHPNFPPYLVFDQNYRAKYPLGTVLPGQDFPAGLVETADTPRELARKLDIDGEGLERTIARFNGHAREGLDPDFDRGSYPWAAMMTGDRTRKNPNLGPLDKPPYYGLRLHVASVGINAAGLRTNSDAQVIHVRGRPLGGLYAVGNSAAPLDIGAGYQSGLSNLRGMVFGYRAALHATGGG